MTQTFIDEMFNIARALNSIPLVTSTRLLDIPYSKPEIIEGHWVPKISRVQYNGDTTIVFFNDGTRTTVKLSENDVYDRKTAIVYAIVKRMLGKVNPDKTVDGDGFGTTLQRIADAGFDQVKAKKEQEEKKRIVKAEHDKRQEAAKKAAFERKVKERAREIAIDEAARKLVAEELKKDPEFIGSCTCTKKTCSRTSASEKETEYVRPDKPFSQFTNEEKCEYWRAQYRNRKNRKNK